MLGSLDILDGAIPQLIHHLEPEFGAFVLLEPQPKNFLEAVHVPARRDVDGLIADHAFAKRIYLDCILLLPCV